MHFSLLLFCIGTFALNSGTGTATATATATATGTRTATATATATATRTATATATATGTLTATATATGTRTATSKSSMSGSGSKSSMSGSGSKSSRSGSGSKSSMSGSGSKSSRSGSGSKGSMSGSGSKGSSSSRPRPTCLTELTAKRIGWCRMKELQNSRQIPVCQKFTDLTCKQVGAVRCPSCVPPQLLIDLCRYPRNVSICSANEKPKPKFVNSTQGPSICPSCRPLDAPTPTCTPEQVKMCYKKMQSTVASERPVQCGAKERAVKDGCCVSCVPPTVSCFKDLTGLTAPMDANVKKCAAEYGKPGFPKCVGDARPEIKSCCRSCRPAGGADRPIVGGIKQKCSRADFIKALGAAPDCELNERGILNKLQVSCGPSCRRPTSSFKLTEVISCLKDLPVCTNNSRPQTFPGERCPTCRPARPVCPKACNTKQVCVRVKDATVANTWKPKCVRKGIIKMRLKLKDATFRTKVKALNLKQLVNVIKEMIERFCERVSTLDRCGKFKERILESLDVKSKKDVVGKTDEIDVEIVHSYDTVTPKAPKRRLLGSDPNDPTTLTIDAVKDSDPALMDVVSSTSSPEVTPKSSSGSKLVSGLAVIFSMLAFLFA